MAGLIVGGFRSEREQAAWSVYLAILQGPAFTGSGDGERSIDQLLESAAELAYMAADAWTAHPTTQGDRLTAREDLARREEAWRRQQEQEQETPEARERRRQAEAAEEARAERLGEAVARGQLRAKEFPDDDDDDDQAAGDRGPLLPRGPRRGPRP